METEAREARRMIGEYVMTKNDVLGRRMEPVFMILGQSAGTVASLAVVQGKDIHDFTYDDIREKLIAGGQILE